MLVLASTFSGFSTAALKSLIRPCIRPSIMSSVAQLPAGSLKYPSMICDRISKVPALICLIGIVMVYAGSIRANSGLILGYPLSHLMFVSVLVRTAHGLSSDPVAGIVTTTPHGSGSKSIGLPSIQKSCHASPSYAACTAIALQQSIVEPPPTARISPTSLALTCSTPSSILSTVGLDIMPPQAIISYPASFTAASTSAKDPFFITEPPPYPTRTFFLPGSANSCISSARCFPTTLSPKYTLVLFCHTKLFINTPLPIYRLPPASDGAIIRL